LSISRASVKCQRITPTETETFSECLVPNCGISNVGVVVVLVGVMVDAGLLVAGHDVGGGGENFADDAVVERRVGLLQALRHLHPQRVAELYPFPDIPRVEEVVAAEGVLVLVGGLERLDRGLDLGVNLLVHRCPVDALLVEVVARGADSLALRAEGLCDRSRAIGVQNSPLLVVKKDLGDGFHVGIALGVILLRDDRVYEVVKAQTVGAVVVAVGRAVRLRMLARLIYSHIRTNCRAAGGDKVLHVDHHSAVLPGQVRAALVGEVHRGSGEHVAGVCRPQLLRVGVEFLVLIQAAGEHHRQDNPRENISCCFHLFFHLIV
jgi:hypothetical protein